MLFYFNTSGSAMTSIPSPIYQGSVGVNEILVLAPFPASTTVTASFVLPNGVKLTPRVAQQGDKDDGYTFANVPGFTIGDMNLWRLTLDKALTQYSGDLSVQFSFTDTSGRVLTSGAVTVTVSAGVPSLPVYPSQEEFDGIAALRSQAAGYCQDAEGYSDDALNYKLDAESAASSAEQAQTAAENAARAAEAACKANGNMEKGEGFGGVQQAPDGVGDGFDFTGKNPNAITLDPSLNGTIPYGASGDYSASFGGKSAAMGKRAFAEGTTTIAKGAYSHAEGCNSVAIGAVTHAEGKSVAYKDYAHSEGVDSVAYGYASHSEGRFTKSEGDYSHAEGDGAKATAESAHAEGESTLASAQAAHSEGNSTVAAAGNAHAEGLETKVYAINSHVEGWNNTIGVEGQTPDTGGTGRASHVEGRDNVATHDYAHVSGRGNRTSQNSQTVIGEYNADDPDALFIVGNGVKNGDEIRRRNAFVVKKDGTVEGNLGGKLYRHCVRVDHYNDEQVEIDVAFTLAFYSHNETPLGEAHNYGPISYELFSLLGQCGIARNAYMLPGWDDSCILSQIFSPEQKSMYFYCYGIMTDQYWDLTIRPSDMYIITAYTVEEV